MNASRLPNRRNSYHMARVLEKLARSSLGRDGVRYLTVGRKHAGPLMLGVRQYAAGLNSERGTLSNDLLTTLHHAAGPSNMTRFQEVAITTLLGHRFSDGSLHVRSRDDRIILKQAIRMGLVTKDGYVTSMGHEFWQARVSPSSLNG